MFLLLNNNTVGAGRGQRSRMTRKGTKGSSPGISSRTVIRYLRYTSLNTFIHLAEVFWDKMIKLLEYDHQDKAADWFSESITKEEGHWMLTHSGPGFLNTNCSQEAHWRV